MCNLYISNIHSQILLSKTSPIPSAFLSSTNSPPLPKMKFQNLTPIPINTASLFSFFFYSQGWPPEPAYYPYAAICTEYFIPINTSAVGYVFNEAAKWADDEGLSQFTANRAGRDPTAPSTFSGTRNLIGEFSISATFCTPRDGGARNVKTVIVASHGLGFDRS
jgi:hypothetical protein